MKTYFRGGYILPATLAFSLVTVAIAVTLLQYTTSVTSLLREDYYRALAKEAAQSGARMASDCYSSTIRKVDNWGASAVLTPNKNCSLGIVSGASNNLNEQRSGNTVIRTTYSVPRPAADDAGVTFVSTGTVTIFASAASTTPTFSYSETVRIKDLYEQAWEVPEHGTATLVDHAPQGMTTFSVVLAADGTIYNWGTNTYGSNINSSTPTPVDVSSSPIAGKTIVQVQVGMTHAMALTSDGLLYAWGGNPSPYYRLLGGDTRISYTPIPVETSGTPMAGKHIVQVSAGDDHTLALSSEGKVYAWGGTNTSSQQVGSGQNKTVRFPIEVATAGTPMEGKHIVQISAGANHSLAVDSDGAVYAWGSNYSGAVGDGTTKARLAPVAVATAGTPMEGKHIVQVAASVGLGSGTSYALASDGTVYSWGASPLGNNTNSSSRIPVAVRTADTPMEGKHIVQISAGMSHALALASDGTAYAWGGNIGGPLGNGTSTSSRVPTAVRTVGTPLAGKKIVQIAAGKSSLAIASDGTLYGWGSNLMKELGTGDTKSSSIARRINLPPINAPPLVPPHESDNPPEKLDTIHF